MVVFAYVTLYAVRLLEDLTLSKPYFLDRTDHITGNWRGFWKNPTDFMKKDVLLSFSISERRLA